MNIVINPQYSHLNDYISRLPELFDEGRLIYSARNVLREFTWEGIDVVVKKYKVPIFINRIAYGLIRKSKAHRSYEYALKLLDRHIRTPQPIAYIEEYSCGLLTDSYLVPPHDAEVSYRRLAYARKSPHTERVCRLHPALARVWCMAPRLFAGKHRVQRKRRGDRVFTLRHQPYEFRAYLTPKTSVQFLSAHPFGKSINLYRKRICPSDRVEYRRCPENCPESSVSIFQTSQSSSREKKQAG